MHWLTFIFDLFHQGAVQYGLSHNANPSAAKQLRNSRLLAWIGIAVLAFGLIVLGWGIFEVRAGLASERWPSVIGHITESNVVDIPQRYGTQPTPIIRYEYEAVGGRYVGKRVSFRMMAPPSLVDQYSFGSTVTVYYDPADPGNSVLQPSMNSGDIARTCAITAVPSVMGLAVLLLAAATRRKALRDIQEK
jgi:hypothetical protein